MQRKLFSLLALCIARRSASAMDYYRRDGVRITHDPYAKGNEEKYGKPGETDDEGFNPYADSVGPGIYGGVVKRDENAAVVIGRQYQSHNPRPGPVYVGGGYTPIVSALGDNAKVEALLDKWPDLVNDVSTGGAMPLHMCGMSRAKQHSTATVIARGGDIEALDTYGMTPLHRMASNNLPIGAQALLDAGADPSNRGKIGESPMDIARASAARDVIAVLQRQPSRREVPLASITVGGAGPAEVNGQYHAVSADEVPLGFDAVCRQQGWSTQKMWQQLNGERPWFRAPNGAYIYFNRGDGHWWIDEPGGNGVFKAAASSHAPPQLGWVALGQGPGAKRLPSLVAAFRRLRAAA